MARFGKYRSRRKKAGAIVEKEEKIDDTEIVEEEPKPKPKKTKPKPKAKPKAKTKAKPKAEPEAKVELKPEPETDIFDLLNFDKKSGGSLHHGLVDSASRGMSDYAYKHIQSAAAHILNIKHDGHHIFSHKKNVNAKLHHFHEILGSSKRTVQQKIKQHSGFKQAVSDAMHSAEKGGAIDFKHEVGAGLSDVVNFATNLANPIKEAKAAKDQYDQIDLHDVSARGVTKNALHAYSGNFHVGSAYMKGSALAAPAFSGAFVPASEGFRGISESLDAVNSFF